MARGAADRAPADHGHGGDRRVLAQPPRLEGCSRDTVRVQGRLPLIAVDDIAALAVTALAAPSDFLGRTIAVAGEVSSPAAIAALLSQELREPVACSEVQVEGVFIYPAASAATSEIAWLRSVYPELHTLRSWLEEGGGLALCRRAVAHPSA